MFLMVLPRIFEIIEHPLHPKDFGSASNPTLPVTISGIVVRDGAGTRGTLIGGAVGGTIEICGKWALHLEVFSMIDLDGVAHRATLTTRAFPSLDQSPSSPSALSISRLCLCSCNNCAVQFSLNESATLAISSIV